VAEKAVEFSVAGVLLDYCSQPIPKAASFYKTKK
jgi:hypothetical protein